MTTPPMPTRFIASRSAVMPLLLILPLSQNQKICGRAESGGCRNPRSRSETLAAYSLNPNVVRTRNKMVRFTASGMPDNIRLEFKQDQPCGVVQILVSFGRFV